MQDFGFCFLVLFLLFYSLHFSCVVASILPQILLTTMVPSGDNLGKMARNLLSGVSGRAPQLNRGGLPHFAGKCEQVPVRPQHLEQ